MVKQSQVALHVRVVLNEKFKDKCLGDWSLRQEPEIYIADEHIYNDNHGYYVMLSSDPILPGDPRYKEDVMTGVNSGYAYLDQIDLKYPISRP